MFSISKVIIENSALYPCDCTTYLFEELLVCGADDDGVGVAHHGDQHVQQQDRDQDLEEDEHQLGHRGVGALIQLLILTPEQLHINNKDDILHSLTSYSPSVMWKRAIQVVM